MKVHARELGNIAALAEQWQRLEQEASPSYFQSWGWIETWLKSIESVASPYLLVFEDHDCIVGLAILVQQRLKRHRVFVSQALFLQESGIKQYDFIIEHNGVLIKNGYESQVAEALLATLYKEYPGWDELYLSGIPVNAPLLQTQAHQTLHLNARVLRESSSRHVNLARLRESGKDYLDILSSNTRYQIRRAIRKYEELGPLSVSVATSPSEAQAYFDQLKVLHQQYWESRNRPGSFANPVWERFHRTLIDSRFDHGEIQLIRISVGEMAIGYLYNLVKNRRVYALQSGFAYADNNALHPGYVSHYFAILHNLACGNEIYDFLAGDARYKDSLSDGDTPLVWLVLQRRRVKFLVENGLRSLHARYRDRLSRRKTSRNLAQP